ncbi:MAG TPA: Ig-like domain-containing protein, partial [Blastocatellia bacterium]|nr:Ig-like domain-containing protein [Blastocatellia bacterium]
MLPPRALVFVLVMLSVLPVQAEAHTFLASSAPRVQSSYTLTATPSQVAPGAQLNVSWTAPSGRPSTDWIALYKVGDPNTTYGSWQYTQGATSGNFTVTTPTTAARYEFRYLLQNGFTVVASSNIVPVTVAPAVSITAPANNTSFLSPAAVTINATASDSDGSVSKVEFFQGSTKLGETTTSPFSYAWTNVGVGSYVLTAKATDNLGAVTTSTAVNITVNLPTGVISGKVTRTDGTTEIAGATVKVYQETAVKGIAATNATGDYTVGALNTGTYSVQASAAGYESATETGVSVTNGATTTLNLSLPVPINYVYDELGRLVSVIDKDGNAATYAYDSVGNLLSISRQVPTQVSIIQFSPNSGPIGASVTIYGTGFSATASQNAVTFNGVAASVTASSPNLVVTSVPTGAASGPVAVTSPTGSATSAASFTVTTGNAGAPTVTGFTPTIGTPGTAVTIAGTNFDTTALNNRSTFNIVSSTVTSATTTSIATSAPQGGSGRISVTTPVGKATSTADFFIPPSPYTAANVGPTGRMAIGASSSVSVNTAGKIGLMLFDGTQGQRIYLDITNISNSGDANVYNPDGTLLASVAFSFSNPTYIDVTSLPATGTYTIMLAPCCGGTASATFTLYDVPPDFSSAIIPGGAAVTAVTTTPGQNAKLTFAGTTGQIISLRMTGVTIASTVWVYIYNPNGDTIVSFTINITNGGWLDATMLPSTGTYTILINPTAKNTGSVTAALYNIVHVTGPITPGGAAVPVTISTPGQNASLTFSGSAGQQVSLNMTSVTVAGGTVYIKKPDGTTLTSAVFGSSGVFVDNTPLPVAGTYTVLADPSSYNIGNLTLTLYDVPDVTGPIVPGGAPVTVNLPIPGQNARLTFSGAVGQKVSLNVTGVTISNCLVTIYKPDGGSLGGTWQVASGTFIDNQTLPAAGTYTILINPSGTYTGNATLTLYDCPDVTGTISPGGASVSVTISTPGQNASLTFSGSAGQQVTLNMTSVTVAGGGVYIRKPDGTTLTSAVFGSS